MTFIDKYILRNVKWGQKRFSEDFLRYDQNWGEKYTLRYYF